MAEPQGKWVKVAQKGSGPGARSSHAITVVGEKVYAFGGEFTPRVPVDNHMHVFDLQVNTWSILEATGDVPSPRVGVTMASVGTTVYVFGGRDAEHTELNAFYSFDTITNRWTLLSSNEVGPPHRSYHSMAADDTCIYIFGGCGVAGRCKDLWAFAVGEGKWIELPEPGEDCLPRGGPGLLLSRGKVWVVYGFSGNELDDVHCFDPSTGKWTQVETSGDKPSPRSVFTSTSVGNYLILFGGEIDPSDLGHLGAGKFSDQLFAFDTITRVWKKLEVVSENGEHPGPRGWCAFSSGKREEKEGLVVYGGNSPTNDRLDDIFFLTVSM